MRRESSLAVPTLWLRLWCEDTNIMRIVQLSMGRSGIVNGPRCWSQNGHWFEAGGPTLPKWPRLCWNHSSWSVKVRWHCKKLNGHSKIGSLTSSGRNSSRGPFGFLCNRVCDLLESSSTPKSELIHSNEHTLPSDEGSGRELSHPLGETRKEVPVPQDSTGEGKCGRLEFVAWTRRILESFLSARNEAIARMFTKKISWSLNCDGLWSHYSLLAMVVIWKMVGYCLDIVSARLQTEGLLWWRRGRE